MIFRAVPGPENFCSCAPEQEADPETTTTSEQTDTEVHSQNAGGANGSIKRTSSTTCASRKQKIMSKLPVESRLTVNDHLRGELTEAGQPHETVYINSAAKAHVAAYLEYNRVVRSF